jgi:hypothetical protein
VHKVGFNHKDHHDAGKKKTQNLHGVHVFISKIKKMYSFKQGKSQFRAIGL